MSQPITVEELKTAIGYLDASVQLKEILYGLLNQIECTAIHESVNTEFRRKHTDRNINLGRLTQLSDLTDHR